MSAPNTDVTQRDVVVPTVKHLYLFDDLSHHVRRLAASEQQVVALSQAIGRSVSELIDCLDFSIQDVNLVNWDHACSQLLWTLEDQGQKFDLIVAQGCNGEYALDSLMSEYRARHGADIAPNRANVRVAHFLNDAGDPFYSDFTIGVSSGPSLREQCASAVSLLDGTDVEGRALRIAVFDDCIQTGEGTKAVIAELLDALGSREVSISTIGFIACESTQNRFRGSGYTPVQGVLLRGDTYPAAWDWDIYFLKDLFLDNAVRFADGNEFSYAEHGDWLDHIFGESAERAKSTILELRAALVDGDVYQKLLDL